jgi:hypothetical protein
MLRLRLIFFCVGDRLRDIQAGLHTRAADRMNVGASYFCVGGRHRGIQAGLNTRSARAGPHECWSVLYFFALEGRLRGFRLGCTRAAA